MQSKYKIKSKNTPQQQLTKLNIFFICTAYNLQSILFYFNITCCIMFLFSWNAMLVSDTSKSTQLKKRHIKTSQENNVNKKEKNKKSQQLVNNNKN